MTNTDKPHYQRVKVIYSRGWYGFRTKAMLYLIDNATPVHDTWGKKVGGGTDIYHFKDATVTLGSYAEGRKMRTGLEVVAQDALKTAKEIMDALKADPKKYSIEDITNKAMAEQ